MSLLEVLTWPHPILDTKSEEVTTFDEKLRQFVADMHETMHKTKGIGLAANQVGVLQRVLTIHIPFTKSDEESQTEKKWWHDKSFTFINPVIVKASSQKISYMEGCLSFPDVYDYVGRSATVEVKACDEFGKEFSVEADGLFAICLQHEIDHIDGIVFFKRMSRLKANLIQKKMKKKSLQNV